MSDLSDFLPQRIELNALKRIAWDVEQIPVGSGIVVRNSHRSRPDQWWEITLPLMEYDDPDLVALEALYADAEGTTFSFNFHDFADPTDGTIVSVRFDSELQVRNITSTLRHVDTLILVEDIGSVPDS